MNQEEFFDPGIQDNLASRANGLSFWHWVYYLNGKGYGFYNTRDQALKARERASAKVQ